MNYFELFGIPLSLSVDKSSITKRFFELQKKYHPDFHGQATEAEKEEVLELSSMVNKAWKTFQSQEGIVKYVLQEKGLLEEEEKYQLPPTFLMEVMDLNEMKMDGAEATIIAAKVQQLKHDIDGEVSAILANYKEDSHSNDDLLRVKDWYYKKKYLDRLLAE